MHIGKTEDILTGYTNAREKIAALAAQSPKHKPLVDRALGILDAEIQKCKDALAFVNDPSGAYPSWAAAYREQLDGLRAKSAGNRE
jgi:hypothetical protein